MKLIYHFQYRTCYQSKSFENLQILKRKPEMKSFEDLVNANFTLESFYDEGCRHFKEILQEKGLPQ
jgi:hypothetical protein